MASMLSANSLFVNGEHKRAFDTYMELVDKNANAIAASNVGYMYHRGIGVTRDHKKARTGSKQKRAENVFYILRPLFFRQYSSAYPRLYLP